MFVIAHRILLDDHWAEDAVQEAFFRAYRHRHGIVDIDSPETRNFLAVITRNVSLNLKKKVRTEAPEDEVRPDEGQLSAETKVELDDLIHSLPQGQRDVLYLTLQGYTPKEIASLLGENYHAVRKRLWRSREALQHVLNEA